MILTVLTFILFSCKNNTNKFNKSYVPKQIRSANLDEVVSKKLVYFKYSKGNCKEIKIAPKHVEEINLNEIIDNIWYCVLESNDDSYFGDINNLIAYKDYIFIHDLTITESVLCFNNKGKFLNKIGRKGKGPGEFIKPEFVGLDKKDETILIWDGFKNKIHKYSFDGSFLGSTKKVGFIFRGFVVGKTGFFFETCYAYNDYHPLIKNHLILFSDFNFQIQKKGLAYPESIKDYNLPINFVNILELNGEVIYRPPMWDTIYKIDDNKIEALYNINFADGKLPENFREFKLNEFDKVWKDYSYVSNRFFFSTSYVWFKISYKSKPYICIYSRNTGETKIYDSYACDPSKLIIGDPFPIATMGDTMITQLPANIFVDFLKVWGKNNKITPEMSKLSLTDNPVLIYYTLKQF